MDKQQILEANLAAALEGDVRDDREAGEDLSDDPRMWLFVRCDIRIPLQKLIAQAAHVAFTAGVMAERAGMSEAVDAYMARGQGKISKRARNEKELRKVYDLSRAAGLPATIVTDAARTYFKEKTVTMAAVGPCYRHELPKYVDGLQVLKAKDILALQPPSDGHD